MYTTDVGKATGTQHGEQKGDTRDIILPEQLTYEGVVHSSTQAHKSPIQKPRAARVVRKLQPHPTLVEEVGGRYGH